jgi:hypothetical protein
MPVSDNTLDFQSVLRSEHKVINRRRARIGRAPIEQLGASSDSVYDTIGLALSGGGIRSAAVCLGVLQALYAFGVLNRIDYLSTVSGGGYIGSCLSATMTYLRGDFVLSKPHAVAQIRERSNYLLPRGRGHFGQALAIIIRGLVANFAVVLSVLLYSATVTIILHPTKASLPNGLAHYALLPEHHFSFTLFIALAGLAFFLLWACNLVRVSWSGTDKTPAIGSFYLLLLAVIGFCELQPFLISGLFDLRKGPITYSACFVAAIGLIAATAVPVAGLVALFQAQLSRLLKRTSRTSDITALAIGLPGKAAIWLAGATLPLIIWISYLHLSYWGIVDGESTYRHAPDWIAFVWEKAGLPASYVYAIVGGSLTLLSFLIKPNEISLLGLYRDRLSRTFLFDPTSMDSHGTYKPIDNLLLSHLSTENGPYHIINAAINVRNSEYANRHGRDADLFFFSPLYAGSDITGYIPMYQYEKVPHSAPLDLGTAMAISGAAVSSIMGPKTVRPLAPSLALLNIRLGYWLQNPRTIQPRLRQTLRRFLLPPAFEFFFLSEMLGRGYTEASNVIYLTDGGHVENLGIYELLRRRCRIIICVDAEADPDLRFSSFVDLHRYASLDLGIDIDFPWESIQLTTVDWMGYDPLTRGSDKLTPSHGPHCAIGRIHYPGGQIGSLIYLKSSLTGDEPLGVRDYARRHASFPHESTENQFFNEEQFEAYRLLGFHIANGLLSGRDVFELADTGPKKFGDPKDPTLNALRDGLIP